MSEPFWRVIVSEREGEVRTAVKFNKSFQISAPSDKQILKILDRQVEQIDSRRGFNGGRVTKQVYLNCMVIGLERLGGIAVDEVFDLGAEILSPAVMADEPNAPPDAGRPLRKVIAEKAAEDARKESPLPEREPDPEPEPDRPNVKPLGGVRLPDRSTDKARRGLHREHGAVTNGNYGPCR